jgi:FKBP-type peptidyl-prolyl cis-trans isomerase (trigger factor)
MAISCTRKRLNDTIRESVDTLMRDKQLRPAMQPTVQLGEGYENGKDAEVTVELEVLPQVEVPAIDGMKLERLTVPVSDADVDAAVQRLAGQNKSYTDASDGHVAADGDQLLIDFVGRVDGTEFEGGQGRRRGAGTRLQHLYSRFRGSADRREGRRAADDHRHLPRRLSGREPEGT